jgi:ABC-type branched-subunit amino acid transport system substrate-binding protein
MPFTVSRPVLGVAALGLALAGLALAAAPALAQSTVKIGGLTEITGPAAAFGASAAAGFQLAVKETNDAGGVNGKRIELVIADNQTNPTIAVNEARRLVQQEKVEAVLGPSLSQFAIATVPITTEGKVLHISTGGSSLLTPELGLYHFSMIYNAEQASEVMVDHAADVLKATKVAILLDNGAQSKAALGALKKRIAERKLTLTGEQEHEFNTSDMTPQILSLRRGAPEAILFFTVSPADTTKLLKTLEDVNWDVRILGNLSLPTLGPNVVKATGPAAFAKVTGQIYAGLGYCSNDALGTAEYPKYRDRLKAFNPDHDKLIHLTSVYGYDSAKLMFAAMNAAKTSDGPTVAKWIESNGYKAVAGDLKATPQSHFLFPPSALKLAEQVHAPRADGLFKLVGC